MPATYQHMSALCQLTEMGDCFDQLHADGWEYLGSHIVAQPQPAGVQMVQGRLVQGQPSVVPCLYSMWRRALAGDGAGAAGALAAEPGGEVNDILGPDAFAPTGSPLDGGA